MNKLNPEKTMTKLLKYNKFKKRLKLGEQRYIKIKI